jgi:hypothetical protein
MYARSKRGLYNRTVDCISHTKRTRYGNTNDKKKLLKTFKIKNT